MKTRRQILAGFCLLPVAALAAALPSSPEIVHAEDKGAGNLECYNTETGEVYSMVTAVCVGQWLERYKPWRWHEIEGRAGQRQVIWEPLEQERVRGPFAVRPKQKQNPPKNIFGYERRPQSSFLRNS